MKYRITYACVETRYDGFEGEEYQIQHFNCKRHFDSFTAKEDFLQEFDMVSEVGDYIISEEEISNFKSNLYYGLACVLYMIDAVTFGKFHKRISYPFYDLMEKTLLNVVREPLCEKFDMRFNI